MKQYNFIKCYRVFEHDTSITEISSNDFRHVASNRYDHYQGLTVNLVENNIQNTETE